MALPQEFSFATAMKPSSAPARGYTSRLLPEAGTSFSCGNIVDINIPVGRPGEHMRSQESSLMFRVKNSGAYGATNGVHDNRATFDGGAWSLIQKIEVFQGSTLLETISDYNILHGMLYDVTTSSNYRQGVGSIMHGTANVPLGTSTADTLQGATIRGLSDGAATLATGTVPGEHYVSMQLVSSILGTLNERVLPVGYLSADIRLRIEFAQMETAFIYSGTPVIEIDEVCYNAVIVALDPSVDAGVAQEASGGTIAMHSSSFRAYTHTITKDRTYDILSLPVRFSSLRYMLHSLQPAANRAAKTKGSVMAREKANVKSFQYRLGNLLVPQIPIKVSDTNLAEISEQLLRIFGRLQTLGDDFGIALTDTSIFAKNDVSTAGDQGTFILGADLNAFGGTLDDLANTGQSLLSTPCSIEITFGDTTATDCPHDLRVTTFAAFDQLLILDMTTGLFSLRF